MRRRASAESISSYLLNGRFRELVPPPYQGGGKPGPILHFIKPIPKHVWVCLMVPMNKYDDVTKEVASVPWTATASDYSAFLRVDVRDGGLSQFSYSADGKIFTSIGEPFQATAGVWIGAKVGLFSLNSSIEKSAGYMDVDWFRME